MRKAVIVIAAVVVGLVGGVITLSSCKRVGQGEVGVVWTMKIKAEAEAEKTRIAAQAEADANAMINNSITEDLIRMKEAEARLKHGWVTVQGAQAVVTDK